MESDFLYHREKIGHYFELRLNGAKIILMVRTKKPFVSFGSPFSYIYALSFFLLLSPLLPLQEAG